MPEALPSVRLEGVVKVYGEGALEVRVLHDVDLVVPRGQLVAIMGPSGFGKSTLLNLLGLLDRPTAGRLFIGDRETSRLDDAERTRLRGDALGFVFQFHHLLPALDAEENVAMPLAVREGRVSEAARAWARAALERLGSSRRHPSEMSDPSDAGGRRRVVGVPRARRRW